MQPCMRTSAPTGNQEESRQRVLAPAANSEGAPRAKKKNAPLPNTIPATNLILTYLLNALLNLHYMVEAPTQSIVWTHLEGKYLLFNGIHLEVIAIPYSAWWLILLKMRCSSILRTLSQLYHQSSRSYCLFIFHDRPCVTPARRTGICACTSAYASYTSVS